VAAAASHKRKRKRSLDDVKRNHKRWLEEEWHDDFHIDKIPTHDLHKRWFGKDVLDWLGKFFKPEIHLEKTHDIDETFTAIILREEWECELQYGKLEAKLDATASANVKVSSSFGLTIIAQLKFPLDLSGSYLYFKNHGQVEAIFKLDARATAKFDSGDFQLANIPIPGAAFQIPGVLTVGPAFKLYASANAEFGLSGELEARVRVANWDIYQTYPMVEEYKPGHAPDDHAGADGDKEGLMQPKFDYSVKAWGLLEAHLKPSLTFGLQIDKRWKIGDAKVELVADGYIRADIKAEKTTREGICPFEYGVTAGAKLLVRAEVPEAFNWKPNPYVLSQFSKPIIPKGTCPVMRVIDAGPERLEIAAPRNHSVILGRRDVVWLPASDSVLVQLADYPSIMDLFSGSRRQGLCVERMRQRTSQIPHVHREPGILVNLMVSRSS
jgi:chitinase